MIYLIFIAYCMTGPCGGYYPSDWCADRCLARCAPGCGSAGVDGDFDVDMDKDSDVDLRDVAIAQNRGPTI